MMLDDMTSSFLGRDLRQASIPNGPIVLPSSPAGFPTDSEGC